MPLQYSEEDCQRVKMTLEDIASTISQLSLWNVNVHSAEDYYTSQSGMQLLAANCMLITAIGEGINRCLRIMPTFLTEEFPDVPWHAIIGMRNHIAHGYFELDADLVFETVKNDIPPLGQIISDAINMLN